MDTQMRHAMLPQPNHDEAARQMFVKSFRGHLAANVAPGSRRVYDKVVAPQFQNTHGAAALETNTRFARRWSASPIINSGALCSARARN